MEGPADVEGTRASFVSAGRAEPVDKATIWEGSLWNGRQASLGKKHEKPITLDPMQENGVVPLKHGDFAFRACLSSDLGPNRSAPSKTH